jgi:dTMP kinase
LTGRGWFITFEGPEGGGKSTQVDRLRRHLGALGAEPLCLREPGATIVGERIRSLLLDEDVGALDCRAEALLFCAARAQMVAQVVLPALAAGRIVLCDRYADSTLAYQGYGRGLPLDELAVVNGFASFGLRPRLTLCLDVPVEVGLRRKQSGGGTNRMESDELAFHQRVRRGYLDLAAADPERWRLVDATQPPDVVERAIRGHVEAIVEGRQVR